MKSKAVQATVDEALAKKANQIELAQVQADAEAMAQALNSKADQATVDEAQPKKQTRLNFHRCKQILKKRHNQIATLVGKTLSRWILRRVLRQPD